MRVTLVIRDSYDIERAPFVTSVVKLLKFLFNLHRLKINIIYLYINIGYNDIYVTYFYSKTNKMH